MKPEDGGVVVSGGVGGVRKWSAMRSCVHDKWSDRCGRNGGRWVENSDPLAGLCVLEEQRQ